MSRSITPSDVVAAIVAAHYGSPTVATMLCSTSSATRASAPVETEPYWTVKTFLPHAGGVAEKAREQAEVDGVAYGSLVAGIVAEHYRATAQDDDATPRDDAAMDSRAPQAQHRFGISA